MNNAESPLKCIIIFIIIFFFYSKDWTHSSPQTTLFLGELSPTEYSLPGPNCPRDDADDGSTALWRGYPLPPLSFQSLYTLMPITQDHWGFQMFFF